LEKSDIQYFIDYISFWNKVYREIWQDMIHGADLGAEYVTGICKKHNLMKRTVNSMVRDIKGRHRAFRELQKQQCLDMRAKIERLDVDIANLKDYINLCKGMVTAGKVDGSMLQRYRNAKFRLFSLQRRRLRYENKIAEMEKVSKLSFGSKAFWLRQYHFSENGYKSHAAWYNDYIRHRNKYIYYLGASCETCGNQMFQMTYDEDLDCFHIRVRKENAFVMDDEKYLYLSVNFKSINRRFLIAMIKEGASLTYRVLWRDNKWYLQVIFQVAFEAGIDTENGCVGVDFNNGFLAVAETDRYGNLKGTEVFELRYHGGGNKAKSEMQEIVKQLVDACSILGKALVIEDLSFSRKKSGTMGKRNKRYNAMLHRLDYSRFSQLCENRAVIYGVRFIKVNPAYTSIIAKEKYCEKKKLNTHIGAAYVIARRGQGYQDSRVA